ncbi:hypothetical protein [Pilosibacter fragilis]|uniref:hypothetical protein n=1 Tax=Pilosibacter fragilis TaxID=3078042 RepID=UPI0032D4FF4A
MGVYRAAIVTENGQNLIAQALANEKPLIFTSAKTSSYSYPVGTDVPALTGLQDVVQSVLPFDSKVLGGNVAQVSVRFDNDGVDQTYRIETIGLYAKIEGGAETLFSVTQATTPDEMPVQSDISPSAYIYNIQHTVQNASQITLTVNPAGTATVQDIMDIETPEFDDSGTVEGISSLPSFLETMKSKMNFFQFFRNLKAGLQFVLHTGQIVNNCVTDNSSLPLSAAQGKVLKDLYTQLYSEVGNTNSRLDTSLSSSVLDYALTLPEGMHTVRFPGDGYTGADTPNSYYRYSSATIIVRSKGKIVTVLLYGISTKAPLAVNSYDGGKWNGWDQYVTKNDLLISASGTGPTDWTALETVENMPFKIWNVTKASTSKGAPAGCYDYGTLIALVATATGDRWRNTLIYLPDNNNNVGNKVYVRSGISTKWLAISGTDVNSVS